MRDPSLRAVPKTCAELRAEGYVVAPEAALRALRKACPGVVEVVVPGLPEVSPDVWYGWAPSWAVELWRVSSSETAAGFPVVELGQGGIFARCCVAAQASPDPREFAEACLTARRLGGFPALLRLLREAEAPAQDQEGRPG